MSRQPYGSAARAYLEAGYWPLPLPPRKKASPPEGYTGRSAREVSAGDVERWLSEHRSGNIGLRLPCGVVGIDVDAYKDDLHLAAWEELTARCGPLPAAPWCSSRDDGISGIRLFRVPEDWEAAGKLPEGGNGVSPGEVIQPHHRYVVAPPSIHPDTRRAYRWRSGSVTKVADLPALPEPWLDALSVAAAPAEPTGPVSAPRAGGQTRGRPGDDFNERADWLADVLGPHGWELHHEAGGTLYVTRPGKSTREGHSATIGHSKDGADRLYVFSADAAPFEMETPYTKFAAWALLNHGGDYQAAARELSRIGYGSQQSASAPAPATRAGDYEVPWPSDPAPGTSAARARRIVLTPASAIEPEPVVWAWEDEGEGRIPAGSLGLAAGREGTGKSSFAIWLTARVTTGTLPGKLARRGVIYVAVEDSWKFTIVPRLMAAGADLDRVFRAEVLTVENDTVSLSLPADNKDLEEAISENDIAMVVLDPLMSAISDTLDTHVNRQVRQALDPLARMADRSGAIVLGIAHFNKSAGTDASSLITASGAFKDVARYIFAFATDPEDGTQVISQTKNSLGRSDLPSLVYRIISATVQTKKGSADVGRFVLGGESDRSVQDILSSYGGPADTAEKTRAEDFLRKALADGPRRTKDVEEEAKEAHGISKRTLERARGKLRIPAVQRPTGQPRKKDGPPVIEWWVALPEHEGDLADIGADRQSASASLGAAVWRCGGVPQDDEADQTATGQEQTATQNALTSTDRQTATPPTLLDAGGLPESSRSPRPDCRHTECHEALLGHCLTEAERTTVRKFSDGGQPWKGDKWPAGSAGADVNPDGGRAA